MIVEISAENVKGWTESFSCYDIPFGKKLIQFVDMPDLDPSINMVVAYGCSIFYLVKTYLYLCDLK